MTTEQFEAKQQSMSDNELIENVKKQISELAKTGGRSHQMCVPPQVTDTDMLLSELVRRFEKSKETVQPSEVMLIDEEIEKEATCSCNLYCSANNGFIAPLCRNDWDCVFKESHLKPAKKEEKNAYNELLSASKAILSNIEKWLETGEPADVETSEKLYDDLKKAVTDAQHVE